MWKRALPRFQAQAHFQKQYHNAVFFKEHIHVAIKQKAGIFAQP